jgi:hypothetical protein
MTVVPVRTSSVLGDGLSIKEMFARYEKRLAKQPDDPEILLGPSTSAPLKEIPWPSRH